MKSAIVAFAILGCAVAASVDQDAKILRSDYNQSPEGNFQYAYETDNGIAANAEGKFKAYDKDSAAIEITGSHQFKSPEGEVFQVSYVANENGYQPQGAHLPTPPAPQPIPDYILRSLEYIAAHPYVEKKL